MEIIKESGDEDYEINTIQRKKYGVREIKKENKFILECYLVNIRF